MRVSTTSDKRLEWQWRISHYAAMATAWTVSGLTLLVGWLLVVTLSPVHASGSPKWTPWRVWLAVGVTAPVVMMVLGTLVVFLWRNPPVKVVQR